MARDKAVPVQSLLRRVIPAYATTGGLGVCVRARAATERRQSPRRFWIRDDILLYGGRLREPATVHCLLQIVHVPLTGKISPFSHRGSEEIRAWDRSRMSFSLALQVVTRLLGNYPQRALLSRIYAHIYIILSRKKGKKKVDVSIRPTLPLSLLLRNFSTLRACKY